MFGLLSLSERQSAALRGSMLIAGVGMSIENCELIFLGPFLRCSFATSDHRHFHCDSFVSDFEPHQANWHHPSSPQASSEDDSAVQSPDYLCSINFAALYGCDSIVQTKSKHKTVTLSSSATIAPHSSLVQSSAVLRQSVSSSSPFQRHHQPSLIPTPRDSVNCNSSEQTEHHVRLQSSSALWSLARPNISYLVLTCLIFTAYWPSLNGELVFDDRPAIVDNHDLRPDTPWYSLLYNDYWGMDMASPLSHKSYRPLTIASFRLNYALHQLRPFGYHLVNVVLHTIVTILVYRLAELFFDTSSSQFIATKKSQNNNNKNKNKNKTATVESEFSDANRSTIPFTTAALFAVHSVHTDSVSSVVGRAELLSSICYLSSILIFLCSGSRSTSVSGRSCLSTLASTLFAIAIACIGFLGKEQCLFVLPYLAFVQLYPLPLSKRGTHRSEKASRKFIVAFLLGTFGLVLYFRFRLQNFEFATFNRFDNPAARRSFVVRTLTFAWMALYHFWLLLNPYTLACDWTHSSIELIDFTPNKFWFDVSRTSLILFVFICGTITILRILLRAFNEHNKHARTISRLHKFATPEQEIRIQAEVDNRRVLHGIALLVVPFVPVSNLFFSTGFVLAERVLYLPSIGFTLLVGLGLQKFLERFTATSSREFDVRRNFENRRIPTTATGNIQTSPSGCASVPGPVTGITKHRRQEGSRIALYVLSLMVLLSGLSLKTHLRSLEWRNEKTLYSSGLRVNPRNTKLLNNLGRVYEREHDFSRAMMLYEQAVRIEPNDIRAHLNLGNILVRQNKLTDAEKTYRAALATVERNIVMTPGNVEKVVSASITTKTTTTTTTLPKTTTVGAAAPAGPDRTVTVTSKNTIPQTFDSTQTSPSESDGPNTPNYNTGQLGNGDMSVSPLYLTAMLRLAELIDRNASRRNELEEIRTRMSALQARLRSNSLKPDSGVNDRSSEEIHMIKSKHHLNHLYNLAIVNYRQGNMERSLELFNEILAQNPNHIESLLASARMIQDKDIDELNTIAWKRLQRLVKLGYKDASVYFNMAMLSTKFGKDNEAMALFEEAIQKQNSFLEAHYNLALLLVKKLDYLRQIEQKSVPDSARNSAEIRTPSSSSTHGWNRNQIFSRAEMHLLKALKINSRHTKSMLVLGDLYAEEKNIEKSRFYYELVIRTIDNGHFRAKHNLCVLLHKENKTQRALQCFESLKKHFLQESFNDQSDRDSGHFDNDQNNKEILQNIDLQIEFLKDELLYKRNQKNSSNASKTALKSNEKIIMKNDRKPSLNNNKSDIFTRSNDRSQQKSKSNDIDIMTTICADSARLNLGAFDFPQMCHI